VAIVAAGNPGYHPGTIKPGEAATEERFRQFLDERSTARGRAAASKAEDEDTMFREFQQWQASHSVKR